MAEDLSNIVESSEPTVLTTGWGRTEGPLWHPEGYVTFVDLEASRLLRWDTNGEVSVVREGTGEGNGCTFDRQGNLIMCEGADHRRVTRMDANGAVTVVADRWDGKRFNKPNDVICRSDGTLFFTDPGLRLPAELREMDIAGVFRVDPQGTVHLATDQCVYPNGLALSPDESVLYVAISRAELEDLGREERGEFCPNRRIEAFDVAADGTLSNQRVFCDMSSADPGVPDGMKVDTLGRVYCVGSGGFWVIEPSGEVAGVVRTSEVTRNLAFGGPDNRTLYMTPGSSLWRMQLKTPGIGAF
jgi:gluconolactonase